MTEETTRCISHAQRLSAVEESSKSAHRRIDEVISLNESVKTLAINMGEMTVEMKQLRDNSEKLGQKVENIELKPARRWEAVVGQVIQLLLAGVVGYLLSQLF